MRKKRDRSLDHAWINWPNNYRRKCTRCGITIIDSKPPIYEKEHIIYNEWIPCIKIDNY